MGQFPEDGVDETGDGQGMVPCIAVVVRRLPADRDRFVSLSLTMQGQSQMGHSDGRGQLLADLLIQAKDSTEGFDGARYVANLVLCIAEHEQGNATGKGVIIPNQLQGFSRQIENLSGAGEIAAQAEKAAPVEGRCVLWQAGLCLLDVECTLFGLSGHKQGPGLVGGQFGAAPHDLLGQAIQPPQ